MSAAFALFFMAAFSLNLILQMGLGLREVFFERDDKMPPYLFRAVNIFVSVLILWHLFVYVLFPLTLAFLCYFMLFPLSFLLYYTFESAADILKQRGAGKGGKKKLGAVKRYAEQKGRLALTVSDSVFVLAALVFTIRLAINTFEAVFLLAGFSAGLVLAVLVLKAIRKRIARENVPPTLRGLPLMLVSMGILALVVGSIVSVILLK